MGHKAVRDRGRGFRGAIADTNLRMARYEAAKDAGGDPAEVGG